MKAAALQYSLTTNAPEPANVGQTLPANPALHAMQHVVLQPAEPGQLLHRPRTMLSSTSSHSTSFCPIFSTRYLLRGNTSVPALHNHVNEGAGRVSCQAAAMHTRTLSTHVEQSSCQVDRHHPTLYIRLLG